MRPALLSRSLPLLSLCALALTCHLAPLAAIAQEKEARVFLRFTGETKSATEVAQQQNRFEATVLEAGGVAFAGSKEMETVFAQCREDIGVSPMVERECSLQAARRVFVEHVLEIEANPGAAGHYELTLTVWDPDNNARVHVSFVETQDKRLRTAAREALPQLAANYLCFRGKHAYCTNSSTVIDTQHHRECPPGQQASVDTAGRCCWPGQGWNGKACVGNPSACLDGFRLSLDLQSCERLPCQPGQERVDGLHCCWPEQAYLASSGRCIGQAKCPDGFTLAEQTCLPGNGRDPDLMRFIPPGELHLGTTPSQAATAHALCQESANNPNLCDPKWYDHEHPSQRVQVPAFYLDTHEVSQARYQRCVDDGACSPIDTTQCLVVNRNGWQKGGEIPTEFDDPALPAVCVHHAQAAAYCTWAGKRLPSEIEWERAAKGDDDRTFPWGDQWLPQCVNWGEKGGWGNVDRYRYLSPVGAFPCGASPYAVQDLAGNAWEWTATPFSDGARTYTIRGGGFNDAAYALRTTYRAAAPPDHQAAYLGFRCAH